MADHPQFTPIPGFAMPPNGVLDQIRAHNARAGVPTRYDQTPSGCWAACIAGLTGLPHDALARLVPRLPDGSIDESMGTEYHNAVNAHLRANGWRLVSIGSDVPRGFAIGSGQSPRDVAHACLVLDGALWHDPHPSRAGVVAFTTFELVVPLAQPVADAWESLERFSPESAAFATACGVRGDGSSNDSVLPVSREMTPDRP